MIGPTEAPPPPKEEKIAARAGFVWVGGRWDWHDGKWQWIDGHWERERAGKKWRTARWEQREGKWALLEGDWVDANAPETSPAPPPVPPAAGGAQVPEAPPVRPYPHPNWKLDRPTVSSYWPTKGKAGAKVRIRGRNFPPDAQVVWGGQPVMGAKVEAEQIMFQVPAGAATGAIALRVGRRELPVGPFEVAAYDAEAEAKKLEDQRRKDAEAAWAARQKELGKDRAAREAAFHKYEEDLERTREERRSRLAEAIRAKWEQAFLSDPDTQSELTLHGQRAADIDRMLKIAETMGDGKLVVRIQVTQKREDDRHAQRMTALQEQFRTKGGAP